MSRTFSNMKRYSPLAAGAASLAYGIAVSIWLGPSVLADIQIARYSSKWPTTSGVVLESRSVPVNNPKLAPVYLATVTYVYEVSHHKYRHSQVICECTSEIAMAFLFIAVLPFVLWMTVRGRTRTP